MPSKHCNEENTKKQYMKHSFVILLSALFLSAGAAYAKQESEFTLEPYLTNLTENSVTVIFNTAQDALCWVELSKWNDGVEWYQGTHPKYYQDVAGRHFVGKNHCITIDGLEKGCTYRYRVLGKNVSPKSTLRKYAFHSPYAWNPEFGKGTVHARTCTFTTLNPAADSCRFSLVCDIHFDKARYSALLGAMPKNNDFIVLDGDIVSHCATIDTVINSLFTPIKSIAANCPLFYARGNHEGRGADFYKLPAYLPTPTGRFYYSFRQGPVAFIVLDAGEDKPDNDIEYFGTAAYDKYRAEELEWLKKAVKEKSFTEAPHKVCIMHIPTFNDKEAWYSQKWICDNFAPVLNEAGVKLMLSGHHHRYILTKPGDHGCKYTIFVNGSKERLDFTADSKTIHIKTFDLNGVQTHSAEVR